MISSLLCIPANRSKYERKIQHIAELQYHYISYFKLIAHFTDKSLRLNPSKDRKAQEDEEEYYLEEDFEKATSTLSK